jgi:hypothetical protein
VSHQNFAGGGILRRYKATAQGAARGGYDQQAKVIVTSYPAGSFPALINDKIGSRTTVGTMVKTQRPTALAAIDGDFFIFPDIRYVKDIEMARGPMVRDGRLLRGTYKRQRVLGVNLAKKPFAGMLAVRGSIQAQITNAPKIAVRSLNWNRIMGGGVNIYTTTWENALRSDGKAWVPRPKGATEWVLDSHDKIKSIRTATRNTRTLGKPVAAGTRVIAFSKNAASDARGVPVGTKVTVNIKQSTDTGAQLYTAVGRGLPVVLGGTPAPLGCNAYDHSIAARPRMFVGWNAQGNWKSFTVPGKNFDDIGLRTGGFGLANAANLAKQLGLTEAYEIDGGGSTTLWTQSNGGKWTRRDLWGVNTKVCACERPMTNGLAFMPGT